MIKLGFVRAHKSLTVVKAKTSLSSPTRWQVPRAWHEKMVRWVETAIGATFEDVLIEAMGATSSIKHCAFTAMPSPHDRLVFFLR